MKQHSRLFGIAGSTALCCLVTTSTAKAQIVPDSTLHNNSNVTTQNNISTITGGTEAGSNLFHSFEQFSVPLGNTAYFNNTPDIQNIISRVTGSSISNIDGLIRANSTTNLFLINPNGIIFGPNASLDIGGSFLASTASSLNFADGTQFRATAPQTSPLLTISVPTGLQFGGLDGSISNQSVALNRSGETVGLQVKPGKTLALVGGDVTLAGGTLTAEGGRIELGSVAGTGQVSFKPTQEGWPLGYEGVQDFKNIQLSQNSVVDASGEGGGGIQLQGKQITFTGQSRIQAITEGSQNGEDIFIQAEQLNLESLSVVGVSTAPSSLGQGGNLTVETLRLIIKDGAQIFAEANGEGQGGDLTINSSESVELIGSLPLPDGFFLNSGLFTSTAAVGKAGNIRINTGQLTVQDGAGISSSVFQSATGIGGNLTVIASESVKITNGFLLTQTLGIGNAGDLTIKTDQLTIQDGGVVSASTFGPKDGGLGQGDSGNIWVNANFVNLSGAGPSGPFSTLLTRTSGIGQGGDITVNSNDLRVTESAVIDAITVAEGNGGNVTINTRTFEAVSGGQLLTTTRDKGNAGDITVNATDRVILSGSNSNFSEQFTQFGGRDFVDNEGADSGLFANTAESSTGNSGNVTVRTRQLNVRERAEVNVSSVGTGKAGNLEVTADSIFLDSKGELTATSVSSQGGGNITLQDLDVLLLRDESKISTNASGTGIGGNITINTDILTALENSDITANAVTREGGVIKLRTQGIFGTEVREQLTENSDITAFSQNNPELNGEVEINRPEIDPSVGLVTLPTELVDVSGLIAQGCSAGGGTVARSSKFVATGRGGLPPTPTEALRSDSALVDLGTPFQSQDRASAASTNPNNSQPTLVEAQGWVIGSKGEVVLIAQAPTVTPHTPWLTPTTCNGS